MESGILTQSKEVLLKILYEGEGEDLLYQDIKVLKRKKKNVWNIFQNILQDICVIFFTVCSNMTTLNEISGVITSHF